MSEQIFTQIRKIEEEAAKNISKSIMDGELIIKNANQQASKILSDTESALTQLHASSMEICRKESFKLRNDMLNRKTQELKSLKEKARKKEQLAINLILDRLSKLIGE